jgi:hypothetical protein
MEKFPHVASFRDFVHLHQAPHQRFIQHQIIDGLLAGAEDRNDRQILKSIPGPNAAPPLIASATVRVDVIASPFPPSRTPSPELWLYSPKGNPRPLRLPR